LKDLGNTVGETSAVYDGIAKQLGTISFTDLQKQWVSHLADNTKLIKVIDL
jgi:hypothetical protein